MAIYKNDNGTWYVMIRYQDWTGARKQKCKRGFSTRKEAADWELQFKLQKKASVDMTMESFCTMYEEDVRPSLKQSTWLTKENIIQKKILPYLGKRKVSEITAKDVMDWHNQMRKLKTKTGKPLSPTYLKTIHGVYRTSNRKKGWTFSRKDYLPVCTSVSVGTAGHGRAVGCGKYG